MNNEIAKRSDSALEGVLLQGNLAALTASQKIDYHNKVCELVGLNPLTRPFDYIAFQGKTVLYANKNCAEQLRKVHSISIVDCQHKEIGETLIVTVKARGADGREDMATAALQVGGLKGDALANAIMKAETKAKRRVTLSICSLGMLDESEAETIPGAKKEPLDVTPKKQEKYLYQIPFSTMSEVQWEWLEERSAKQCDNPDYWICVTKLPAKMDEYLVPWTDAALKRPPLGGSVLGDDEPDWMKNDPKKREPFDPDADEQSL